MSPLSIPLGVWAGALLVLFGILSHDVFGLVLGFALVGATLASGAYHRHRSRSRSAAPPPE